MINAVDEAHSDLGVVVGHQDDVKQLLAVRVELPQSVVDVHQRLRERGRDHLVLTNGLKVVSVRVSVESQRNYRCTASTILKLPGMTTATAFLLLTGKRKIFHANES